MTPAALAGPLSVVEDVTRDGARGAALRELARPEYEEARPPLLVRAASWLLRELGELVTRATGGLDGPVAQVLLALLVGGLAAVVLVRLGPLGRRGTAVRPVFGAGGARSAQEHRAAAQAAADAGRYAEAVRERLRAVVRELEVRGVLDARAGRTATEVAHDAGAAVPALREDLRAAAALFDAVVYGGQGADAGSYDRIVQVDRAVSQARLAGV